MAHLSRFDEASFHLPNEQLDRRCHRNDELYRLECPAGERNGAVDLLPMCSAQNPPGLKDVRVVDTGLAESYRPVPPPTSTALRPTAASTKVHGAVQSCRDVARVPNHKFEGVFSSGPFQNTGQKACRTSSGALNAQPRCRLPQLPGSASDLKYSLGIVRISLHPLLEFSSKKDSHQRRKVSDHDIGSASLDVNDDPRVCLYMERSDRVRRFTIRAFIEAGERAVADG
jgi:hypothetical protein